MEANRPARAGMLSASWSSLAALNAERSRLCVSDSVAAERRTFTLHPAWGTFASVALYDDRLCAVLHTGGGQAELLLLVHHGTGDDALVATLCDDGAVPVPVGPWRRLPLADVCRYDTADTGDCPPAAPSARLVELAAIERPAGNWHLCANAAGLFVAAGAGGPVAFADAADQWLVRTLRFPDARSQSQRVSQLCAGASHILVLTADGGVFSWGQGGHGELGTGALSQSTAGGERDMRLRPVGALAVLDVLQIAAGKFHSAALTRDRDVYTWGWNESGQLGYAVTQSCPGVLPSPVDLPPDVTAVRVACSSRGTAVLTDGGRLLYCGTPLVLPDGVSGSPHAMQDGCEWQLVELHDRVNIAAVFACAECWSVFVAK